MNSNEKALIEIVNMAINDTSDCNLDGMTIDWKEVFDMACDNGLAGITQAAVAKISDKYNIDTDVVNAWKKTTFIQSLPEHKKYHALKELLTEGARRGIKFILFKGSVLADLYPQYVLRKSSDSDIFVYERDKEKAIALIERYGYVLDEAHTKEQVYVYTKAEANHTIELHFCLWEDYEGDKMDRLCSMNLTDESTLINLNICNDMDVTTLGYEEHLIFQIFHIVKHFIVEGVGIRYMTDISLYIKKYGDKIDRKDFFEKMEYVGYDRFCDNIFSICIEYFGMPADIMQGRKIVDVKKLDNLVVDFIRRGKKYDDKDAGYQILGIMTPYLVGEEKVSDNKFVRNIKVIFPTPKNLPEKCDYARKNPILLPIAWVHRWADFIKKKSQNKDTWYSPTEKLDMANYRLTLLKDTGLVGNNKKAKKKK